MASTRELEMLFKLDLAFDNETWDELSKLLSPKIFVTIKPGDLMAYQVLAKVAYILTTQDTSKLIIPQDITIICLKCLGNSCFNGYKYKEYPEKHTDNHQYYHNLYKALSANDASLDEFQSYPHTTHFPYEGVAKWASDYVVSCNPNTQLPDNQLEILRLSIQFLCNLFTFACKDNSLPNQYDLPKCLYNPDLKNAVMNYMRCEPLPLVNVSSIFIHNALKELPEDYFTMEEKTHLLSLLIKPMKEGFESAKETLLILLNRTNVLQDVYEEMTIEDRLYLLETIYTEISDSPDLSDGDGPKKFSDATIEFLSQTFRRKSDLILKTVDTYLNGLEPTEIIILLDILGVATSTTAGKYDGVRNDRSLLINCIYLLKSIQMLGKESENVFTPLHKISDVAPSAQGTRSSEEIKTNSSDSGAQSSETMQQCSSRTDPCSHPTFGLKAALIRVIGNMSHQNKMCQDLLREEDAIPLLLDCCNIDGRNPFIMQWSILALRNLCEGNPENQEIIRNCAKVGVVDNSVLKELGLTLHEEEDGKKIGIAPLVRKE